MSSGIVLPLDTNNAALEVVGGKGRSLAAMASAGMSVPDGFYVITSAYRQYVADSNLQAAILGFVKLIQFELLSLGSVVANKFEVALTNGAFKRHAVWEMPHHRVAWFSGGVFYEGGVSGVALEKRG